MDNINLNTPECDRLKVQSKNIPELVQSDENASDSSSVVTLSSPEEPSVDPEVSLLAQVYFICFISFQSSTTEYDESHDP